LDLERRSALGLDPCSGQRRGKRKKKKGKKGEKEKGSADPVFLCCPGEGGEIRRAVSVHTHLHLFFGVP